jgi:CCR4-NOT transcription complex subunit 2
MNPTDMFSHSEFPSLSNNQTQPSQSTWAAQSARNAGPSSSLRTQASVPLSAQQQAQQQQQDDLFSSSSQLPSTQGGFRFGNQSAVGQSASHIQGVDEFPPLSRNANGDIGQDRGSSIVHNVGFGAPSNGMGFGAANPPQSNGLLNAINGNRAGASNRGPSPATGKSHRYLVLVLLLILFRSFKHKITSRGRPSRFKQC